MATRKDPPPRKRADKFRALQKKHKDNNGGTVVACGKICHESKSSAKSAIRRKIGMGTMTEKELMGYYWCPKCSAYHIGHDRTRDPERWR